MNGKSIKIHSAIFAIIFVLGLFIPLAAAAEPFALQPLTPQLSSDGQALYNGIPAVVYRTDPNPAPQQAHIPSPLNLLTLPEKATATFTMTYIPNGGTSIFGYPCIDCPADAQTAMNAAAVVWGNLLNSSVPITINVCWSNALPAGILGGSGGGTLVRDFPGAPLANTWYSESLANALAGSEQDASNPDMHIVYNSTYAWYYGTDGVTPAGQYDLMSVVLHEIAHGLNFSGSMRVTAGSGSWGYNTGYPNIYDTFMRDGSANPGNLLINTGIYPNPSINIANALTSDNIWFHGANAMTANSGTRVKMYAPATWAGGSSYSHLDYTTFSGGINRLMVYAISSGMSTHDPGPVTLGVFKDLGWTIGSGVTADLAVSIAAPTPASPTVGNTVTDIVTIFNNGTGSAWGTTMTGTISGSFVSGSGSATPSQGTCNTSAFPNITCNLGTINNGASATVTLAGTPASTGSIVFSASVSSGVSDPVSGNNSATRNVSVVNPVPAIVTLSPASTYKGGPAFTLTVNGSNFVSGSTVLWNGSSRTTTFVSFTQLTAQIPATDLVLSGVTPPVSIPITVNNPVPGGGTSSGVTFTVNNPSSGITGGGSGGGGGGGGCFIAMAGHEMESPAAAEPNRTWGRMVSGLKYPAVMCLLFFSFTCLWIGKKGKR